MTVYQPEEEEIAQCVECENDTFYCILAPVGDKRARIRGIRCSVCGEETEFRLPEPGDYN